MCVRAQGWIREEGGLLDAADELLEAADDDEGDDGKVKTKVIYTGS